MWPGGLLDESIDHPGQAVPLPGLSRKEGFHLCEHPGRNAVPVSLDGDQGIVAG